MITSQRHLRLCILSFVTPQKCYDQKNIHKVLLKYEAKIKVNISQSILESA